MWWRPGHNVQTRAVGTLEVRAAVGKVEIMTRAGREQDKLECTVEDEKEGKEGGKKANTW